MKTRASTSRDPSSAPREPEEIVQEKLDRARLKQKAISLLLTAVFGSLIVFTIAGEEGAIGLYRKWQERRSLEARIQELEAMNAAKRVENARLATDPDAVERFAREELDMMRPGEIMFVLPEPEPSEGEGAAAPPTPQAAPVR